MNSSSLRTAKPADEATDDQQREAAWLQTEVEQRRAEVDTLTRSLSEVSTEEAELVEQLRSLKYALELTRGEVERRTRGNTELHSAYAESAAAAAAQSNSNQHHDSGATYAENTTPATTTTQPSATAAEGRDAGGKDDASEKHGTVQGLEAELLNAKRDVANVVYEIETLQIRYKQLTEMERLQKHNLVTTAAVAAAASTSAATGGATAAIGGSHSVNNSNSNVTASSPKPSLYNMAIPMTVSMSYPSSPLPSPTSTSNNNSTATTAVTTATGSPPLDSKNPPTTSNSTVSPTTSRSARLIADVDALIGFEFAYAPCRLGLQANGQMAIYSYSSPSPLLIIDDILDRHVEKLSAADALALGDRLRAVRVHTVERSSPFQQKEQQQLNNDDVYDVGKQQTKPPGQAVQTLCGLAEAVRAATQLMEDSKHAIHTGERRT